MNMNVQLLAPFPARCLFRNKGDGVFIEVHVLPLEVHAVPEAHAAVGTEHYRRNPVALGGGDQLQHLRPGERLALVRLPVGYVQTRYGHPQDQPLLEGEVERDPQYLGGDGDRTGRLA